MRKERSPPIDDFEQLVWRAGSLFGKRAAFLEMERNAVDAWTGGRGNLSFLDLQDVVGRLAARMRACGFAPGERMLILGVPRPHTAAAIFAALAAGLDPVVAPAHLLAERLERLAASTRAAAILSPPFFGDMDLRARMRDIAERAPTIRFLGVLQQDLLEETIDFSPASFAFSGDAPITARVDAAPPRLGLVVPPHSPQGRVVFFEQTRFLNFGRRCAGFLNARRPAPIVSTLSLASAAGFAGGPLLSLLTGASLSFAAPFAAQEFLSFLDTLGQCHLTAPELAIHDFANAGLADARRLSSLLLARYGATQALPPDLAHPLIVAVQQSDGELLFQLEAK